MQIFSIDIFGLTIAPTYYGLMYALAFLWGIWYIGKYTNFTKKQQEDLFVYLFFGVILGGRLGYVFFYNLVFYIQNPLDIFKIWEGGMSFHGWAIGVIIAMWYFAKTYKTSFLSLADLIVVYVPVGLGLGRIGNYVNEELLGFEWYAGPLAIVQNGTSYFPSSLVEAILEWPVLLLILVCLYKKNTIPGMIGVAFLFFYGVFRFGVEFVRLPDSHIGYLFGGWLTIGHILSAAMVIVAIVLYLQFKKKRV